MQSKKFISLVLVLVLTLTMFTCLATTTAFAAANRYTDAATALDAEYAYDGELGAIYTSTQTTFKVWAPTSESVKLNLYTKGSAAEEGNATIGNYDMEKLMDGDNWTGVWQYVYSGDANGIYYTYTAQAKNILGAAVAAQESVDPYAKAVGVNGKRGMVIDLSATDPEGWENDEYVLPETQTEVSVWEVHVQDFSYNPNSGVSEENRGKYLAFTETDTTLNDEGEIATCVNYLKTLGITHVQINPFYDFETVDETGPSTQFNWGYDPRNYNAPKGYYSSDPYNGEVRVNEVKQMIQALHDAGIGVIMDVVYNHTYSTNSCFQRLVPDYYYRKTDDGAFVAGSGCGNDTASEREMFRKFMVDSVRYWAEEYHIDGFRFDLMGLQTVEVMNDIRDSLDEIDPRLIMYGEGWNMTTLADNNAPLATQTNCNLLSERIAVFNDCIRDGIKGGTYGGITAGFIQGSKVVAGKVVAGLRANTIDKSAGWTAQQPSQSVAYMSSHDNLTLWDQLVLTMRPKGTDFTERDSEIVDVNKLGAVLTHTAQGITFMLAGEEMARTKKGDENSYTSSAEINMIDWNNLVTYADLVSYYKGLQEIRDNVYSMTRDTKGASMAFNIGTGGSSDVIMYRIRNNTEGEWNFIVTMVNASKEEKTISVAGAPSDKWVVVANKTSAGVVSLGEITTPMDDTTATFTIPPQSALIVVDKESFDAANIQTQYASVTIKHVLAQGGKELSSSVLLGTPGEKFTAAPDEAYSLEYDATAVGSASGIFGQDKVITFKYSNFVPERLITGDLDNNQEVTIAEATILQKHIAQLTTLSPSLLENGDYDYDGECTIGDVTMLQKHLAGFAVGINTVTTTHTTSEGKEVSPKTIRRARVGTDYSSESIASPLYTLDTSKLPQNASGTVSYGSPIEVKYLYADNSAMMTIHFKDDGANGAPSLWAWYKVQGGGADINVFDSGWPGYEFQEEDLVDGWYTIDIPVPSNGAGYYVIISYNGGGLQTMDYGPYPVTNTEMWMTVKPGTLITKGDWLDIQFEKPTGA